MMDQLKLAVSADLKFGLAGLDALARVLLVNPDLKNPIFTYVIMIIIS